MSENSNIIAFSNPGGRPSQYRVQFRVDSQSIWLHSAVFINPESAQQRAQGLREKGYEVRTIHYRLPTAA